MKPRYYQKQAIDAYNSYEGNAGIIVLPTGSGKSLIQAYITEATCKENKRVLLLTHQSELIKQNYSELISLVHLIDAGIYSAGLKLRHTDNRVIFAGIQSVHKKALHLGKFDLILIDEAHLINTENAGMYRKFISRSLEINPDIKLIGLTATPFRLKGGYLNHGKDAIFKDFIHETPVEELMDANHIDNLDKVQYLSKLISKRSAIKVDLSQVKLVAGEYNKAQMEEAFDVDEVVKTSIQELLEYTFNRKKVLIFAAGIKHAEHIASLIPDCGIVHSKLSERDIVLDKYKTGELKYLVNVDVLTTGFNVKDIDSIALMRSTKSPGLYVQMVGRGTRIVEGKKDCLVLDFGDNVLLHGPIDKLIVKNPSGKKLDVGAPVRECEKCHSLVHISKRFCPECGFVFPENPKHNETANEENVVSEKMPPERVEIADVEYHIHIKEGKPASMRVDYYANFYKTAVSEYICLDHGGFATMKAMEWIRRHLISETPDSLIIDGGVEGLLEAAVERKAFKKPVAIMIDYNSRFSRVVDYEYGEETVDTGLSYEELPF